LQQAALLGKQQQDLANQYQGVISGTAGPSLAELAMQRAAGQEARRNISMAAGIGGPGSIAATINAQNRNALAQGELQQNLGIQRAAEVEAARQGLGNVLTGMRGQAGAEAGQYGAIGGLQQGIGAQFGNLGQIGGQQALGNAALQGQQNSLNQQGEQFYYGQGANWQQQQANLNATYAANANNYSLGQQGQAMQQSQFNADRTDKWLGAGLEATGAVLGYALTPVTGGASAVPATALAADAARKASDIRGKTAIAPAGGAISDAYRGIGQANEQASRITGTRVEYPEVSGSSYLYKNPSAPGAEPGQHYGPMAHELERTPAGASVVRTMPDGSKGIDTGRLALLNASETGKLRREVDALKSEGVGGTVAGAASTGTVKPARLGALAAKQEANAKKSSKNDRLAALISSRTGSIADRLSNPLRRTVLPTYAPPPIYAQPLPQQPQPLALQQPSYFYGQ
jgi:hypothetical protein